jgi:hypothetical protein
MFDDFFGDWEDEYHQENKLFNEYLVVMKTIKEQKTDSVSLTVWATSFDEALTCGEILSAVYCA